MEFEWDPEKGAKNLAKHGVAFDVVFGLDWATGPILDDDRFDYREARYILYGRSSTGARYVVAFTLRTGIYRIISVRPFGRKEWRLYGDGENDS